MFSLPTRIYHFCSTQLFHSQTAKRDVEEEEEEEVESQSRKGRLGPACQANSPSMKLELPLLCFLTSRSFSCSKGSWLPFRAV